MINERVQGCIADTLTVCDTFMLLFCKENRKVAFSQYIDGETVTSILIPQNDTLTLPGRKMNPRYVRFCFGMKFADDL